MPKLQPPLLVHLSWSVAFMLGFSLCGWWLAALEAPWFLWLGSFCLLMYLVQAGTGAIVPGSLWITGLILAVVTTSTFPDFWAPNAHYRHWARVLLSLWGFCTLMIYLLGRHSESLRTHQRQSLPWGQTWYLAVTYLGLHLGSLVYRAGLFF